MRGKKVYLFLVLIFLAVLGIRLFFVFQTETFSDSNSYFNLRQIESIRDTGLPIFNDNLSYSGRFYIFFPLFHYLIAAFTFIMPISLAINLIPNILMASLVFLAYLIANELTKNKDASLMSALMVGFIPVIFLKTVNTLSVYSLVLPMTFLTIYFLMRLDEDKRFVFPFMLMVVLMAFTDSSSIIMLVGFFFYLFISWIMKLPHNPKDLELISFSALLVILLSFILFKNLFIAYGPELVWQNIPSSLFSKYFLRLNIFEAIYQIGVLPFILGIYVIYKNIFIKRDRNLYILLSFALSLAALLGSGLVAFDLGIVYFSAVLAILASEAYLQISEYLLKTKFRHISLYFVFVMLIVLAFTSIMPSIIYSNVAARSTFSAEEIKAFQWLNANTPPGTVIAATLEEGHLVTSISKRNNIMDSNFLMRNDAEQRLKDIDVIYTTNFQTEAVRLLNKYRADYIVFSPRAVKSYGRINLNYAISSKCFEIVYVGDNGKIIIYKSLCTIEEEQ